MAKLLPTSYALYQNYPNPCNPLTKIEYDLPKACKVRLEIYNVLGQMVRTLVDARQEPGRYSIEWDGTDADNRKVSTGIYFYHIDTGEYVDTKKMLLLK